MTFDPDKKNTHVQWQNALFQFKLKNSMLSSGDKNSRFFLAKNRKWPFLTSDQLKEHNWYRMRVDASHT